MTQPDILLIVLDTTRRDRLSIYNPSVGETSPAFDAFADRATLFERAVAPAQWTIPAHASMFTGLYPTTHQLTQADRRLSGSYPALAEILQADGYDTVGFCNNPLVGVLENGLSRGFERFYNYAGAAPHRPHHAHRGRVRRALSRRWQRFATTVSNRFAHSDWLFRHSLNPLFVPFWTRSINYTGNTAHSIDDLIDTLRTHRAGGRTQPLFGFLNLMGAHLPYRPPLDALRHVAPQIAGDKAAFRFMRRFNAEAARWASPADPPLTEWESAVIDAFYRAEIFHQDMQLRRLFAYLQESGALDDTLVIVTADHGEGHGDHDYFGHSFVVFQELVHVPLAISYPAAFPQGKRITNNVSTRRVFHTVLDAVGIAPPIDEADPNANTAGLTLARSLNGTQDADGGRAFSEAVPPQTFLSVLEHHAPHLIEERRLRHIRRGVYEGDHKLALVGADVEAMYNVADDPSEQHDIAAHANGHTDPLRDAVAAMVAEAERYRAGGAAYTDVDDSVKDHLRALGYIE